MHQAGKCIQDSGHDVQGKVVWDQSLPQGAAEKEVDIEGLRPGTYLVTAIEGKWCSPKGKNHMFTIVADQIITIIK